MATVKHARKRSRTRSAVAPGSTEHWRDDETLCIIPSMILKPLPQASARSDYRLVVFDFDGTLADRFDWLVQALNGIAPAERDRLRDRPARMVLPHLGVTRWKWPAVAHALRRRLAEDLGGIRRVAGVAPPAARGARGRSGLGDRARQRGAHGVPAARAGAGASGPRSGVRCGAPWQTGAAAPAARRPGCPRAGDLSRRRNPGARGGARPGPGGGRCTGPSRRTGRFFGLDGISGDYHG